MCSDHLFCHKAVNGRGRLIWCFGVYSPDLVGSWKFYCKEAKKIKLRLNPGFCHIDGTIYV